MKNWIKKYLTFDGIMIAVSLFFIIFIWFDGGFTVHEKLFGVMFFGMTASISYANIK